MADCPEREILGRYAAGLLSARARGSLDEHLRVCEACRVYLRSCRGGGEAAPGDTGPLAGPASLAPVGAPRLDGYEIVSEIRRGGQGAVYEAIQMATRRTVAIKILHRGEDAPRAQKERFEREIEVLASLHHPGIVTIFESGTWHGSYYFVMEYVEGKTLDRYLAGASPGPKDRVFLLARIASAVGYAHERGVVHRDLKPANILVDERGEPHVLDFGLAKALEAEGGGDEGGGGASRSITSPGEFLGTLAYAAPEQTLGDPSRTDARTDVYALGVVSYEALTGARPYPSGKDVMAAIRHVMETDPEPPAAIAPGIDDDVSTIVLQALAKEPDRRYGSAGEMAEDLLRYLDGRPIEAKRASRGYVAWKRLRRWAASRPVVASVIAVLLVGFAGDILAGRFGALVELDFRFASIAQGLHGLAHGTQWSDRVVVVGMTDETADAIEGIAAELGIRGVRRSNLVSWRAVHGRFMERLAEADARVLVWDVVFESDQPAWDGALARGIDALREAGTPVVGALRRTDRRGRPVLSSEVASRLHGWGWYWLPMVNGIVRGATLLVDDPPAQTPSLALAAFAAWRAPRAAPSYRWDGTQVVTVRFHEASGGGGGRPARWPCPGRSACF